MKKATCLSLLFLIIATLSYSQTIDASFSQEKMLEDLDIFKNIRLEANSGLYKYRTKQEIDSIYHWAEKTIATASTYRDFYNIICHLTDFEGSLHNDTSLPKKINESLKKETFGYFPYPIKWIDGKWIINYSTGEVPLGAEILSINNEKIDAIIKKLLKYYTTDGVNITGKRIGLTSSFSKYYRLHYGLVNSFLLEYKTNEAIQTKKITLESIGYNSYFINFAKRYSKPFDQGNHKSWDDNEIYSYKSLDESTGVLTINDFGMGNEKNERHLKYVSFLDSVFRSIKKNDVQNLIVDVRYNGGGTDPNDLVTYSYLTQRNFSENKAAWVSFKKIPYLKYIYTKVPRFLRPFGVGKYNKTFKEEFPDEKNGKFYQNETSADHLIRKPNENAFTGKVYLLISPRVASAGSLFAAMVAGNTNTIVIGEETMGGYYGHNGHTGLGYILPKSKIETFFDVVNLEQDVPKKKNQIYNRGIIPDHTITQTYQDFINQEDVQMNFVLNLIKNNTTE